VKPGFASRFRVACGFGLFTFGAMAAADGGVVVHEQAFGSLRVTLFAAPTPLRVGQADLSALVRGPDLGPRFDCEVAFTVLGDEPVDDQDSMAHSSMDHGSHGGGAVVATREEATNKWLYHALVPLGGEGTRTLHTTVQCGSERAMLMTPLSIRARLPVWAEHWQLFSFPPVAVCLFGLHQWRRRKRATKIGSAR
jgi:hypothetical protein